MIFFFVKGKSDEVKQVGNRPKCFRLTKSTTPRFSLVLKSRSILSFKILCYLYVLPYWHPWVS